ncbi:MAG: hypothetical protein AAFY36_18970 [Bacteroidota bacterium]
MNDIVRFDLLFEGKSVYDKITVEAIDIRKAIGQVSIAQITCLVKTGNLGDPDFEPFEDKIFATGATVEIKLGYDDTTKSAFKGIVLDHHVELGSLGIKYHLQCAAEASKLVGQPQQVMYTNKSDSEIINHILGEAGLEGIVETTDTQHEEVIQSEDHWDFICLRAKANNLLVYIEDGKVQVQPITASDKVSTTVEYGDNVYRFNGQLSTRQGRLTLMGSHTHGLNKKLEIKGFGKRFNGKYLISGVRHRIYEGIWESELIYGLSSDWTSFRWADYKTSPQLGSLLDHPQAEPSSNSNLVSSSEDLLMKDQHGNQINMTANGIEIKSIGDFKLNANNIEANATMSASLKGEQNASLTSSVQTVVKGAMVMIN